MKSLCLSIALGSLLGVAIRADASPVLLATLSLNTSGGGEFGTAEGATAVALGLIYDPPHWEPGKPCLGCGIAWAHEQTGQLDFTAQTPFFSFFQSHLTNGANELIHVLDFFSYPTPGLVAHGAVGQFEDVALGRSPDFVGHHVDLIRLTVTNMDITVTPASSGRFNNQFTAHYQWDFYEDIDVPEPASITLLLCGAAVAGLARYFGRR